MKRFIFCFLFAVSASAQVNSVEISDESTSSVVMDDHPTQSTSSRYFYRPPAGRNSVNLSYRNSSTKYKTAQEPTYPTTIDNLEAKFTTLDFRLARSVNENFVVLLDAGYQSGKFETQEKIESNGLTDIFLGAHGISNGQDVSFLYGGSLGVPPEAEAAGNYNGKGAEGNSSSGSFTLNPFVGVETRAAGGMIGAKASSTFFMSKMIKNSIGESESVPAPEPIYGVDAFYEFPISESIIAGITVGIGRDQEYITENAKGLINMRRAKLYGEVGLLKDTFVNGSLSANSWDYYGAQTMTAFQVGLKRTL